MKYYITLLLCVASLSCFSQGFLVTNHNDTILLNHPIEVRGSKTWNWKSIQYDGAEYAVSDLKSMYLDKEEYTVVKGRFWKKIINGKIEVFARASKDSLTKGKKGIPDNLMMRTGENGTMKPLNFKNLATVDNQFNMKPIYSYYGKRAGRVGLIISGIGVTAISGLVTLVGAVDYQFAGDAEGRNTMIGGLSGMGIGLGLLTSGVSLNKGAKHPNILDMVRSFNAK
jgi:hypothetical protein